MAKDIKPTVRLAAGFPRFARLQHMPRLDTPGVLHHIMGRGIERRKIFLNDRDRNDFIDRLAALCFAQALEVYAWVLMPDHFRILCKTMDMPLASQDLRNIQVRRFS